jgi:hypothetical protein
MNTSSKPAPLGRQRVITARRPMAGRTGRCLAVRLTGTQLDVLVAADAATIQARWMPAQVALTEDQAERWARTGF